MEQQRGEKGELASQSEGASGGTQKFQSPENSPREPDTGHVVSFILPILFAYLTATHPADLCKNCVHTMMSLTGKKKWFLRFAEKPAVIPFHPGNFMSFLMSLPEVLSLLLSRPWAIFRLSYQSLITQLWDVTWFSFGLKKKSIFLSPMSYKKL